MISFMKWIYAVMKTFETWGMYYVVVYCRETSALAFNVQNIKVLHKTSQSGFHVYVVLRVIR